LWHSPTERTDEEKVANMVTYAIPTYAQGPWHPARHVTRQAGNPECLGRHPNLFLAIAGICPAIALAIGLTIVIKITTFLGMDWLTQWTAEGLRQTCGSD
jgi:hypothetical protein